jgi:hypothetical protein
MAGHDHFPKRDLRGITWERDFPESSQVDIHHISDGPLYLHGINWTFLPEGVAPYFEKSLRILTKESWKHFVRFHPHSRWFLRGCYDMYVNVTNLLELVKQLERAFDPEHEFVARYGCHFAKGFDYPHGSTGHLFSAYAVRQFIADIPVFDACPQRFCDDICL